ncbi:unnamed protein product, partial [Amoebophrya sp. A120]|eukprot:GSA120T00020383001.1
MSLPASTSTAASTTSYLSPVPPPGTNFEKNDTLLTTSQIKDNDKSSSPSTKIFAITAFTLAAGVVGFRRKRAELVREIAQKEGYGYGEGRRPLGSKNHVTITRGGAGGGSQHQTPSCSWPTMLTRKTQVLVNTAPNTTTSPQPAQLPTGVLVDGTSGTKMAAGSSEVEAQAVSTLSKRHEVRRHDSRGLVQLLHGLLPFSNLIHSYRKRRQGRVVPGRSAERPTAAATGRTVGGHLPPTVEDHVHQHLGSIPSYTDDDFDDDCAMLLNIGNNNIQQEQQLLQLQRKSSAHPYGAARASTSTSAAQEPPNKLDFRVSAVLTPGEIAYLLLTPACFLGFAGMTSML